MLKSAWFFYAWLYIPGRKNILKITKKLMASSCLQLAIAADQLLLRWLQHPPQAAQW